MSDKTTAAIAAEQQSEAPEAPAEALPAVTLDELEQVDLGTVEQGECAPFRITDDRCADWAIRKIAEERGEYNRLKELADQQKAAIDEKVEAARRRMENGTGFLTSCLADFFRTVPHKTTKTTEITVSSVHFCDSKKDGAGAGHQDTGGDFADYPDGSGDFTEVDDNGDLPF